MLVPSTYTGALLLTILTMICWGSWANTMKLCGRKWRFELFYFDYAIGVFLAALVAGVTFGSMEGGSVADGVPVFSFWDNILVAFRRYLGFAFLSGVVFNLANMLLVAAIAVAGLSVAFPIGIGLALIIGVIWSFILNPQGNPAFLFGGMTVLLGAIIVAALAHKSHVETKPAPTPKPGAPPKKPVPPASPWKGIGLSLVSGILMGSFYPVLEMSKHEFGLGPYAAVFVFSAGVLLSTPLFNIFFMNVPVQGDPVGFGAYFKGKFKYHVLGLLGGIIWCIGMTANFVAASTSKAVNVGPAVSYAIGQGATLVSTLWGLLVWHEFKGAVPRTRSFVALMLILFVAGLGLIAAAPLFKQ